MTRPTTAPNIAIAPMMDWTDRVRVFLKYINDLRMPFSACRTDVAVRSNSAEGRLEKSHLIIRSIPARKLCLLVLVADVLRSGSHSIHGSPLIARGLALFINMLREISGTDKPGRFL
jgi:hypothetical protein